MAKTKRSLWHAFWMTVVVVGALNGVILGISVSAPTIRDKCGPMPDVPDWLVTVEAALDLPALLIIASCAALMSLRPPDCQAGELITATAATLFWGVFAVLVKLAIDDIAPATSSAPNP